MVNKTEVITETREKLIQASFIFFPAKFPKILFIVIDRPYDP
jgi:hypothetical protein